jgi:hypothetical protein
MPPKKRVVEESSKKSIKKVVEHDNNSETESYVEEEVEITRINSKPTVISKPSVYLTNTSKNSDTNSDRIQLAQAINNFTLKSEQLLQEMKSFETFRESIAKLDILIETKKQEYKETTENLELNHKNQVKKLEAEYYELKKKIETEYSDRNKSLNSEYLDKTKKLESEFVDKKKILANTYEDSQLDIKRKITEDKSKQCELYAKELKMKFIKEEDHKALFEQVQKALTDHNELKKSFDKQCDMIRSEEIKKYSAQLKNETTTIELTHKANNAATQAQVEQQKKEIQVLQQTIDNLKSELREQRELTKEVAQASSRAQITQTIGKN